ncbi:hypothetical protein ACTJIJ_25690 [Niabella sp. 22666]|uniref:hypothetical protein n=1 Tax=Niabella sp. 22666 TaxID=3453954 RepID=UPI003F861525
MSVFSYHLVKTSYLHAFKTILLAPGPKDVPGLVHAECMSAMTLGAPVFSSSRILIRQVAVFAQWEEEAAIDHFLHNNQVGKILAGGWHTRLVFMRQWGSIKGFKISAPVIETDTPDEPVVAVTIARMKFSEIPRFIRWGRPVEELVRDHPGTALSLASVRLPNTVSTFSIWRTQKEMTDMVLGHSAVPRPGRHINAMKERDRKDFHFEFTTLRFKPIAEFGKWNGHTDIIRSLKKL